MDSALGEEEIVQPQDRNVRCASFTVLYTSAASKDAPLAPRPEWQVRQSVGLDLGWSRGTRVDGVLDRLDFFAAAVHADFNVAPYVLLRRRHQNFAQPSAVCRDAANFTAKAGAYRSARGRALLPYDP